MKLLFDYDSSLNNLIEKWVEWINKTQNLNYKVSDVDTYDWVVEVGKKHNFDSFAYFDNALPYTLDEKATRPIKGSQEFMRKMSELTDHQISILTATHDNTLIEQKDRHIKHYFGDELKIIHDTQKHKYAICEITDRASILMDDNPDGCKEWVMAGGYALLYTGEDEYTYASTHYEHPNLKIVKNYDEALEEIKRIKAQEERYKIEVEITGRDMTGTKETSTWRLCDKQNYNETVGVMKIQEDPHRDGAIYVERVKIRSDLRNQGLGKKFFAELFKKEKPIYLDVVYDAPISFYKSMGFEFDSDTIMSVEPKRQQNKEIKGKIKEIKPKKEKKTQKVQKI